MSNIPPPPPSRSSPPVDRKVLMAKPQKKEAFTIKIPPKDDLFIKYPSKQDMVSFWRDEKRLTKMRPEYAQVMVSYYVGSLLGGAGSDHDEVKRNEEQIKKDEEIIAKRRRDGAAAADKEITDARGRIDRAQPLLPILKLRDETVEEIRTTLYGKNFKMKQTNRVPAIPALSLADFELGEPMFIQKLWWIPKSDDPYCEQSTQFNKKYTTMCKTKDKLLQEYLEHGNFARIINFNSFNEWFATLCSKLQINPVCDASKQEIELNDSFVIDNVALLSDQSEPKLLKMVTRINCKAPMRHRLHIEVKFYDSRQVVPKLER